ncbi:F-box family protein [Rhynchospora pubera]|uniref:F-box family protein n=1 Tax=Rhynchospora pubera TaxID=906938 RepID=A0AAV8EVK2_9POAL|nr:F-box family protein [Rhynchospora pubera]
MERVGRRLRSDVDMISSLPDCLIHVIMSFLTAQEAVRTCILSKRWEKLWTTLPFLDFDMSKFECDDKPDGRGCIDGKFERFLDFVSMTLLHRDTTDMHKFHVSFSGKMHRSSKRVMFIRSWIVYALKHNVQVFKFDSDVQDLLVNSSLPLDVFTCASLVDVSISRTFPRVGNIKDLLVYELLNCLEFSNLKDLSVECLCLSCHFILIVSFLNDCPNLEKLSLHRIGFHCEHGEEVHVNQESLKIAPFKGGRLKTVDVQFYRHDYSVPRVWKYLQDHITENSRAQIIMTSLDN